MFGLFDKIKRKQKGKSKMSNKKSGIQGKRKNNQNDNINHSTLFITRLNHLNDIPGDTRENSGCTSYDCSGCD